MSITVFTKIDKLMSQLICCIRQVRKQIM